MRNYFISPKDIFQQASDEPIITSLLDVDIYKFSMGQLIRSKKEWSDVEVKFALNVRSSDIQLGNFISIAALKEQLDHVRQLKLTEAELAYLRGMPIGEDKIFFQEPYLKFLKKLSLPPYVLTEGQGNIQLTFSGKWSEVTYWETIAMSIISEMYYYGYHKKNPLKPYEFMATYATMIDKVQQTILLLKEEPGLTFSEFGTRRRHSKKWQRLVLNSFNDMLPLQCVGSSNVLLSMQEGSSNPKGTNAHELPMGATNLTDESVEQIRNAQYEVIKEWYNMYPDLSVILGDTFGTTQFLNQAPQWIAEKCIGARIDSKDPNVATEEYLQWWKSRGIDPKTKILIASDGLNAESMVGLFRKYGAKVKNYTFGLGTMATNNCAGAWPNSAGVGYKPFSMVIKMIEANGKSTVKLSDNPSKAMGSIERVNRFISIFGTEGMHEEKVTI